MKNNIEELKEKYPVGTRIKLLEDMNDSQPIKAGEIGTIDFIDSMGSLQMTWDNGRSLAVVPEVDKFEVIERPEKIKVIIIEPEKDPYIKEIYNTLKAEQEIVGGLIQCLPTMFSKEDTYDFIVNDEGKLLDLPLNRYIYDKQDIVAGNIIIAKADISTGEFVSIDDSQVDFLMKQIEEKCPKYNSIELQNNMENEYDLEDMDK
jgi:hypothetical protein